MVDGKRLPLRAAHRVLAVHRCRLPHHSGTTPLTSPGQIKAPCKNAVTECACRVGPCVNASFGALLTLSICFEFIFTLNGG